MDGVNVAVALGSNVGDRPAILRAAIEALQRIISELRASSFYDAPYVGTEEQPAVLNGAVIGRTSFAAHALLERLLAIEKEFGRTRPYGGAPRTLDLDLILAGNEVIDAGDLQVPHPRFRDRLFVLDPLCEIAPDLMDPVTRLTIRELRTVRKKAGA